MKKFIFNSEEANQDNSFYMEIKNCRVIEANAEYYTLQLSYPHADQLRVALYEAGLPPMLISVKSIYVIELKHSNDMGVFNAPNTAETKISYCPKEYVYTFKVVDEEK